MKKQYQINIQGTQTLGEQRQDLSLYTLGDYAQKSGKHYISYRESEATGFDGDMTTLEINSDRCVTLTRTGKTRTQLIIENHKRNVCHYDTGLGGITMGVSASDIQNRLGADGGTLSFTYSLDIDASTVCENSLNITVRENKPNV